MPAGVREESLLGTALLKGSRKIKERSSTKQSQEICQSLVDSRSKLDLIKPDNAVKIIRFINQHYYEKDKSSRLLLTFKK